MRIALLASVATVVYLGFFPGEALDFARASVEGGTKPPDRTMDAPTTTASATGRGTRIMTSQHGWPEANPVHILP